MDKIMWLSLWGVVWLVSLYTPIMDTGSVVVV